MLCFSFLEEAGEYFSGKCFLKYFIYALHFIFLIKLVLFIIFLSINKTLGLKLEILHKEIFNGVLIWYLKNIKLLIRKIELTSMDCLLDYFTELFIAFQSQLVCLNENGLEQNILETLY